MFCSFTMKGEQGQIRIAHFEEDILKRSGGTLQTVEDTCPEQGQSSTVGSTQVRGHSLWSSTDDKKGLFSLLHSLWSLFSTFWRCKQESLLISILIFVSNTHTYTPHHFHTCMIDHRTSLQNYGPKIKVVVCMHSHFCVINKVIQMSSFLPLPHNSTILLVYFIFLLWFQHIILYYILAKRQKVQAPFDGHLC